jgi:hypothetical protein
MAIKWESVKQGDVLFSVVRQKMGNTAMSRNAVFSVRILEIHHDEGYAMVSWNNNPAVRYSRRHVEKLRRSRPQPKGASRG